VRPRAEAKEKKDMKALLIVTDSEAVPAFERTLASEHEGFTVMAATVGSGRSGVKAGDRVHPGGSSLIFTVVSEGEEERTLAAVRRARDAAGVAADTRIWAFDVTEVG
jgi:hypothetical protein